MNNAVYADPGQKLYLTRWLEFTFAAFHTNSYTRLNLMHLSEVTYHVYTETWTPRKDGVLYCKKDIHSEGLDIDKHTVGIYKEDRLVGNGFVTGDLLDCASRGHLSWSR